MALFEKFGEFGSAEEINKAAEGLKAEGDIESLRALAAENGIDEDNVEDYVDDVINVLVTPLEAAIAKLTVEENEEAKLYKDQELIHDWIDKIRLEVTENENFACAVRKKGKSLKGCIAKILSWSFSHQIDLDKELIKAAGVGAARVAMGVPGMRTARELIKEYYLG